MVIWSSIWLTLKIMSGIPPTPLAWHQIDQLGPSGKHYLSLSGWQTNIVPIVCKSRYVAQWPPTKLTSTHTSCQDTLIIPSCIQSVPSHEYAMAKNESYSHCRCPTASKYNLSITHGPVWKIIESPQRQAEWWANPSWWVEIIILLFFFLVKFNSVSELYHDCWQQPPENVNMTQSKCVWILSRRFFLNLPPCHFTANKVFTWGAPWFFFLSPPLSLLSLKASLSFFGMVKNAVETGRSFISFVPVGGVGHRLTNGPVKMLQLSE